MANQGDSSHARELFVNYLCELFASHNYMFYREIEIIHTLKIDCSHDIPPRDEIWARIGGTVTCCKIDGSFRAFGAEDGGSTRMTRQQRKAMLLILLLAPVIDDRPQSRPTARPPEIVDPAQSMAVFRFRKPPKNLSAASVDHVRTYKNLSKNRKNRGSGLNS